MAQGSIRKFTAKDGTVSWRARADGGTDTVTGKRRQQMETFGTRTAAKSWIREQQRRAERGEWYGQTKKTTLEAWIKEWLSGAGARGRRSSTIRVYKTLLVHRVVPALGKVALGKLTPAVLERFFHEQEQDMAPSSAHTLYAALHVCLADAERLGILAVNPLRRVKSATPIAPERRAWTPEEARRFLAAAAQDKDHALWLLLLSCGLRIGEAMALKWEDVDFDHARLTVRRTLTVNAAGRQELGTTTKTGKTRTDPLSAEAIAALRMQHDRVRVLSGAHRDVWDDNDLIFPNPIGRPWSTDYARTRLRALCAQAEVPVLLPHGLRHTFASLVAEHAPVAVVRDLLGHSSLAITNIYVHAGEQAKRDGADALARILGAS